MSLQMKIVTGSSRTFIKPVLARITRPGFGRGFFSAVVEPFFFKPRKFWQETGVVGGIEGLWCGAGEPRPEALRDGVVLYIHGGGFCFGSPGSHKGLAAELAQKLDRVAFCPRYRLAPENPFPAGADDTLAAYEGLLEMGVPADRIVLAGDSAGGNLALGALGQILAKGLPKPAALVAFSPVTDLTFSAPSIAENKRVEAFLPVRGIEPLMEAYLAGQSPEDPVASPFLADFTGAPPIICFTSTIEILRDDTLRLVEKLKSQGVQAEAKVYPDCIHAWPIMRGPVPEANAAVADAVAFVKEHTTPARVN